MSNSNALPIASIMSVPSRIYDASIRKPYQYSANRAMTHVHDHYATLDKVARGCNTPCKTKKEETMTINRRDLALATLTVPALAVSTLAVSALTTPVLAASADEEAGGKKGGGARLPQHP